MCDQYSEILIYKGKEYEMEDLPAESYFDKQKKRPEFEYHSTALYRGYIGHWKIRGAKLYLTKFETLDHNGFKDKMGQYFSKTKPVFANWYSGKIRLGIGEKVHHGTAFIRTGYKTYFILHFNKGELVRVYEENSNKIPLFR